MGTTAAALPAAPLQTPSLTIGAAVPPPSLSHASCRCLRLSPRHRTLQMLPPTAPRPPPLLLRRGFCNDSSSRASPGGRVQSLLPASAVVAVVSRRRRSASCAMHSSSSFCTICGGRQTSFKTSSTQSSRSMVDFQPRRTKDTLPSNLPRPNPLHTVVLFASFFFFLVMFYVWCFGLRRHDVHRIPKPCCWSLLLLSFSTPVLFCLQKKIHACMHALYLLLQRHNC